MMQLADQTMAQSVFNRDPCRLTTFSLIRYSNSSFCADWGKLGFSAPKTFRWNRRLISCDCRKRS